MSLSFGSRVFLLILTKTIGNRIEILVFGNYYSFYHYCVKEVENKIIKNALYM